MIIIPDSNILISALINGKGKEFRLLTGSYENLSFATPSYLVSEINTKVDKIRKKTANTAAELSANIAFLLQHISVIDEQALPDSTAKNAVQLLRDIDLKDVLFVALMLHLDALLWTGDLRLLRGMHRKGYRQVITTKDLENIMKGI